MVWTFLALAGATVCAPQVDGYGRYAGHGPPWQRYGGPIGRPALQRDKTRAENLANMMRVKARNRANYRNVALLPWLAQLAGALALGGLIGLVLRTRERRASAE